MRTSILFAAFIGITFFNNTAVAQSGITSLQGEEQNATEAAPSEIVKISPDLKAKALNGESVSVIIQLSAGISPVESRIVRDRYAARLEALDRQARQLSKSKAAPTATRRAADDRDNILRAQRRDFAALASRSFLPQQTLVSSRLESQGARIEKSFRSTNAIHAELPASAILALEDMPEVVRVVENKNHKLSLTESTAVLGAPIFWDNNYAGGTQTVAIIDSGITAEHLGFSGIRVSATYQLDAALASGCATGADIDPWDRSSHGTHVAGIVASQGVPGEASLKGVAPGLNELISVKVGAEGKKTAKCPELLIMTADVMAAIEYVAIETAASVVNLSLGAETSLDDDFENWVLDQVADIFDITFVVAAGNSGQKGIPYQVGDLAVSYNAIAVANLDSRSTLTRADDVIAASSSKGPTRRGRKKPDVAAPGTKILSLAPGSSKVELKSMTGTSMAAPHITGAVALLLDAGVKGLKEVKALLLNSADGIGWARDTGFGSASLENAFRQLGFIASNTVKTQQPRYYRFVVDGPSRATLVWNRHIDRISADHKTAYGDFSNLDLIAYEESTNRTVASSISTVDNVEQVNLTGKGTAILKVSQRSTDIAEEDFALAFSNGNFEEVSGPDVNVSCSAASDVSAGTKITISCRATNTGNLPLHGATLKVSGPSGFTATGAATFAKFSPAESVNWKFEMNTSSTARGAVAYSVNFEGLAFGDTYVAKVPMNVSLREPKQQDCTPLITPANGTVLLSYLAQSFTVKVQFPRYDPSEPGFCSYDAWETSGWFTLSGRKSGQGDGEFQVNVIQNNKNSLNTIRNHQFRLMPAVDYRFQQYHAK